MHPFLKNPVAAPTNPTDLNSTQLLSTSVYWGTNTHRIPGPEIRVLKTGDGGFEVACDCSDEPLEESHESPHLSTDHFSHVDGREIPAADWLALEDLADAWYDVDPWKPPEGYTGIRKQRRQQVREAMEERAEGIPGNRVFSSQSEQRRHKKARKVACPYCEASAGSKCVRPSGHSVRNSHAERLSKAEAEGIIETDSETDEEPTVGESQSQRELDEWVG